MDSESASAHQLCSLRGLIQWHHGRKQRFDLLHAIRFSRMGAEEFQLLPALTPVALAGEKL